MHSKSQRIRNVTFFVLVAMFAALLAIFWPGTLLWKYVPGSVTLALAIAFALLGGVLVVLTLRLKEARIQRTFFLLAGASAVAIPICAILHNLVYGLFIWWFGEGFWERHGMDEGVFFILALFVCPALFLVGALGSIVLLIKDSQARHRL